MKMPYFPSFKIPPITRFILLAATISLVIPVPTHAESGQALSISPPLIELTADPGQTVTATIKITNISSGKLLIKTQFNDFGAKNETGEPNIVFDEAQSTSSLRSWIAAPNPLLIASKKSRTVKFPISVPKNAEPGGHYAVVRFTGNSPDLEQSGVALSASIGTLVLLNVSGDVKEQASMQTFFTATPALTPSSFFEQGPITFVERVKNEGNVHIKPTGTIQITDMFGRRVSDIQVNGDPNDPRNQPKSALPQSIRRFEQTYQHNGWMFGKYDATLALTYGQDKKPLTANYTFWVIPYKLILTVVAILAALFFGLRLGFKKYNAHIINQANQGSFRIKKK